MLYCYISRCNPAISLYDTVTQYSIVISYYKTDYLDYDIVVRNHNTMARAILVACSPSQNVYYTMIYNKNIFFTLQLCNLL